MRLLHALPTILLCACGQRALEPGPAPEPAREKLDLSGWHVAGEESGLFLAWQPEGGEVPRNREFEVAVVLLEDGGSVPGARLSVRGWMPDHQHGLVKEPQVFDEGDGAYRVEGVLLHMRGSWELIFDVTRGTTKTSFPFELEL